MTNHYIRQGSTGTNNGTDWNNAWIQLPSTLIRNDTYYIADGNYPSYTVDDAVSGTTLITIKKATISDHGTETGWNSSYGDGQAIFNFPVEIGASYVTFDGVVGSGSDPNSYGFRIATPTNCNQSSTMFLFPNDYQSTFYNITVSHVSVVNCNITSDTINNRGFYSQSAAAYNMTLSHCYVFGNSCNFQLMRWNGGTITHNFFEHNWSSPGNHGEQISSGTCSDIVFAYNILKNSYVGGLAFHETNNIRWKVYNNLAYNTDGRAVGLGIYGDGDTYEDVVIDSEFYHNTTANIVGAGYGSGIQFAVQTNSNNKVYNNLWFNCTVVEIQGGNVVHDNNAFYNSSGYEPESHIQISTGDPFVNSTSADFHLNAQTNSGISLPSPYDIDFDGNVRTHWDRGAFEFGSMQCPTPIVSFNINII